MEDIKRTPMKTGGIECAKESDFEFVDGIIKKYKGGDKEIRIPEEIHGKAVRRLETNWESGPAWSPKFTGRRNSWHCVESIHLPSSLESIGDYCFYECRSLRSVEFASDIHLKSIGEGAFDDCPILRMVKISRNFGFKDRFPKSVRFEVISS